MKTVTIKSYVYFWVSDGRCDEVPTVSQYRMSGENWVPAFTDGEGKPVQSEVLVQLPENFDWRNGGLRAIAQTEQAERAAFSVKMQELAEAREKLLAIEYTPATVDLAPAGLNAEDGDDIPF